MPLSFASTASGLGPAPLSRSNRQPSADRFTPARVQPPRAVTTPNPNVEPLSFAKVPITPVYSSSALAAGTDSEVTWSDCPSDAHSTGAGNVPLSRRGSELSRSPSLLTSLIRSQSRRESSTFASPRMGTGSFLPGNALVMSPAESGTASPPAGQIAFSTRSAATRPILRRTSSGAGTGVNTGTATSAASASGATSDDGGDGHLHMHSHTHAHAPALASALGAVLESVRERDQSPGGTSIDTTKCTELTPSRPTRPTLQKRRSCLTFAVSSRPSLYVNTGSTSAASGPASAMSSRASSRRASPRVDVRHLPAIETEEREEQARRLSRDAEYEGDEDEEDDDDEEDEDEEEDDNDEHVATPAFVDSDSDAGYEEDSEDGFDDPDDECPEDERLLLAEGRVGGKWCHLWSPLAGLVPAAPILSRAAATGSTGPDVDDTFLAAKDAAKAHVAFSSRDQLAPSGLPNLPSKDKARRIRITIEDAYDHDGADGPGGRCTRHQSPPPRVHSGSKLLGVNGHWQEQGPAVSHSQMRRRRRPAPPAGSSPSAAELCRRRTGAPKPPGRRATAAFSRSPAPAAMTGWRSDDAAWLALRGRHASPPAVLHHDVGIHQHQVKQGDSQPRQPATCTFRPGRANGNPPADSPTLGTARPIGRGRGRSPSPMFRPKLGRRCGSAGAAPSLALDEVQIVLSNAVGQQAGGARDGLERVLARSGVVKT